MNSQATRSMVLQWVEPYVRFFSVPEISPDERVRINAASEWREILALWGRRSLEKVKANMTPEQRMRAQAKGIKASHDAMRARTAKRMAIIREKISAGADNPKIAKETGFSIETVWRYRSLIEAEDRATKAAKGAA